MSTQNRYIEYENKGLTGLANLGNSCFLNSCMQILSHTYELNNFLNNPAYKKKLANKYDSALLIEWDNLRQLMWSENCIISPNKFVNTVRKLAQIKGQDLFTGYAQNDLPEFLTFVIDCFHTSLSREVNMSITGSVVNDKDKTAIQCYDMIKRMYAKEYSEIWNMFYGVFVSQLVSIESNEIIGVNPEPFFMVNLPIPSNNKSPSLIDCFDLYIECEILDGDNSVFNEKIQKKEAVKKNLMFWSFPNILVIDLKRFNSNNRKNQILVTFPLDNLDLSKYVVGYKKESFVYELYGICNHSGNVMGGHYTAYIKNANGKWYHFNDTSVSEVPLIESIITPKAYCLFYRKKHIN